MAWYVDLKGRQVCVPSEETAYTVDEPEEQLPLIELSYLSQSSKTSAAYEMHVIDEDSGNSKGKKKQTGVGKQRGFVVRSNQNVKVSVTSSIQAAADWLVDSGVVARIDVDETSRGAKKKKRGKKVVEGENDEKAEDDRPPMPILAGNECRADISGRCHHQAHGCGFRVDVAEGNMQQRIYFFTSNQDLKPCEWHEQFVKALEATGARVLLARSAEDHRDSVPIRSEAQADEDKWLQSMLGSCMVGKPETKKPVPEPVPDDGDIAGGSDTSKNEPVVKSKPMCPPWLRR